MATFGTPYEGRDEIIVPLVYQYLSDNSVLNLGLFTNSSGTLGPTSLIGDISEPSGTGYAAYALEGTWSSSNGVVTYSDGSPANPQFENTGGTDWVGDITGAYISGAPGVTYYLLHFKFFSSPITLQPGQVLEIDISSLLS